MAKRIAQLVSILATWFVATSAFAEDAVAGAAGSAEGYKYIAAALAIGVAAFGGAIGQGRAATAVLEGIARNPGASGKLIVPMILCLALIESLVIYALLVSFRILG